MKNERRKKSTIVCVLLLGVALTGVCACGEQTGQSGTDSLGDEADIVITLSDQGSSVSRTAEGVKISENRIAITAGGEYALSGSLRDGQIYVEVSDEEDVTLLFDGVSVINETEPAVYVEQAAEVRVVLAEGTENLVQSGTSLPQTVDEDASGGALFSRDDLILSGEGSLSVNGYINDGIHGNDDLTIESGTITVEAAHHAVRANETLTVSGGTLNLVSGTDGLHSDERIVITGGAMNVSSGDDGIHADTEITIEDGEIEITASYEGIEANQIYVAGGDISVTAEDDGFNANGGQNGMWSRIAAMLNPEAEQTEEESETVDPELIFDGGNVYVNAGGDGLDSNGDLIVNGGTILVDGPESSANGAIDSGTENGGVCQVNGGTVLAIGASGMAERFGDSSTQNSFYLRGDQAAAGTWICVTDADGNEIFSHTSAKSFSSIVFSSPVLETGAAYTVNVGEESITYTQTEGTYTDSFGSTGGGRTGGFPGDIPGDIPSDIPSDIPGDLFGDGNGGIGDNGGGSSGRGENNRNGEVGGSPPSRR